MYPWLPGDDQPYLAVFVACLYMALGSGVLLGSLHVLLHLPHRLWLRLLVAPLVVLAGGAIALFFLGPAPFVTLTASLLVGGPTGWRPGLRRRALLATGWVPYLILLLSVRSDTLFDVALKEVALGAGVPVIGTAALSWYALARGRSGVFGADPTEGGSYRELGVLVVVFVWTLVLLYFGLLAAMNVGFASG
jgi:hypothetical protein